MNRSGPERVFVGWDKPLLTESVNWLLQKYPNGFENLVIGVPGGRSAWYVRELFARSEAKTLIPPRVVTAGRVPEELIEFDIPPASSFLQSIAWQKALEEIDPESLKNLTLYQHQDGGVGTSFVNEILGLYREMAGEGRWFRSVEALLPDETPDSERKRWQTLAEVEMGKDHFLTSLGFCDPQNTRQQLIENNCMNSHLEVALIGVPDCNDVLRTLIDKIPQRITLLIGAPDSLSGTFDQYGRPNIDHWSKRSTDLAINDWWIAEDPAHQAELVVQTIAELDGEYPAEEISVGVPDHSVAPYIQRNLEEHGIIGRDAAGTPITKVKPTLLLDAVATYLSSKSFSSYVWLLRHPDIQHHLPCQDSAIHDLDSYFNRHFPVRVVGNWLQTTSDGRNRRLSENYQAVEELLGELTSVKKKSLADWSNDLKIFLVNIYGVSTLLPHLSENDRVLVESFRQLLAVFEKCDRLPKQALPRMSASEAISFIIQEIAATPIPPDAPKVSTPTIELLGWLELALDEAPALILTGMNNEIVPTMLNYPEWLPESLREDLGIDRRDRRFTRDAYIFEFLVNSKERLKVISGRRGVTGDPLLPSRILFNVNEERIATYAEHALKPIERPDKRIQDVVSDFITFEPKVDLEKTIPTSLRVSAFRTYLESPYMFYLKHILNLETIDDDGQELDPAYFGTVAHAVLDDFGRSEARESSSPKEIREALDISLDRLTKSRFGNNVKPAVVIQMEQLRHRLHRFAEHQATQRSNGWIIQNTESHTEKELLVDGIPFTITGTIDRLDWNEQTGQWAILDYKTNMKSPHEVHRVSRTGEWKDLQLPLYRYLLEEHTQSGSCLLGYINIDADETIFQTCTTEELDTEEGLDQASEVIRNIRKHKWADMGRPQLYGNPTFRALCGEGLVGGKKVDISDG